MPPFYKKIALLPLSFACFFAPAQTTLFVGNGGVISNSNTSSITVTGDIRLANGSTLVNNGSLFVNNGNWFDQTTAGTYSYGNGQIRFTSTSAQEVTTPNTFAQVEFNGPNFQTRANLQAADIRLLNGVFNTNTFALVQTDVTSPGPVVDNASWVSGTVRQYIDFGRRTSYTLPVGNSQFLNTATITNVTRTPLTGVTYIDASFVDKPGGDAGLSVSEDGTPYVSVNHAGVWMIAPDATSTSGQFNLQLSLNGFTQLTDNAFGILQRPASSGHAQDWVVPAGSTLPAAGATGRTVSSGVAIRNGMTSFGQFGIGMANAALPATLVDFNATRSSSTVVRLDWQTATEQNNQGFGIERRYDYDSVFTTHGFVPSQAPGGSSNSLLSYSFSDLNNYQGVSYYRLKQTDLDGRSVYSLIKAVKGNSSNSVSVLMWPNPSKGQFSIRVTGNTHQLPALITDISGAVVRRITIEPGQDLTISGLTSGAYIIRIADVFGSGEGFSEKVVVVK